MKVVSSSPAIISHKMSDVGTAGKEAVEGDKEGVRVETPKSSLDEAAIGEGYGNSLGFSSGREGWGCGHEEKAPRGE